MTIHFELWHVLVATGLLTAIAATFGAIVVSGSRQVILLPTMRDAVRGDVKYAEALAVFVDERIERSIKTEGGLIRERLEKHATEHSASSDQNNDEIKAQLETIASAVVVLGERMADLRGEVRGYRLARATPPTPGGPLATYEDPPADEPPVFDALKRLATPGHPTRRITPPGGTPTAPRGIPRANG